MQEDAGWQNQGAYDQSIRVLCIPSSSISISQWPLQSILTAPNCQITTDLLQTSGPRIKGRYILFFLFKKWSHRQASRKFSGKSTRSHESRKKVFTSSQEQYAKILKLQISSSKIKKEKNNQDKEFNHILRLASILKPYESFLGWICKLKWYGDFKARLFHAVFLPTPKIWNATRDGPEYFQICIKHTNLFQPTKQLVI